jgi:hypothetical protein
MGSGPELAGKGTAMSGNRVYAGTGLWKEKRDVHIPPAGRSFYVPVTEAGVSDVTAREFVG